MLFRKLTGLWRSMEETGETPKYPALKTNYYNIRKDQLLSKLVDVLTNKLSWNIVHVDKERGEIMVEKKQWLRTSDIVITVYDLPHLRSAVDVVSAIRGPFGDLGTSYENIVHLYSVLNREIK